LHVDESALTGESVPVEKDPAPVAPDALLPDRSSMVHAGTTVAGGSGRMIVTAAGAGTELGRIGRLVAAQDREETPLEKQAERLGRRLAVLAIGLSALVTVLGLLRDRPLLLMLETGVILAIAAIPEGLPAVTTIALAAGVRRMAKADSLVRRLSSVETLGCTSVICTDKTGTLTENAMRVTRVATAQQAWEVTGSGYSGEGEFLLTGGSATSAEEPALRRLLEIAAHCNDAKLESHDGWHVHGSSTEGALLALARKAGVDPAAGGFERLSGTAFSSTRKRMSVVLRDGTGRLWSFVKGSPEAVAERATRVLRAGGEEPLDAAGRETLLVAATALGRGGFRVLAFAYRPLSPADPESAAEEDLVWAGIAGLIDPPRAGVREAIAALRDAGIRTVMVTGDQKGTARAVAEELGIAREGDLCLDSAELAAYAEAHRWADLRHTAVFARVSPEDKLAIVRALKSAGHVVAMTGDGVNDAPALKAADIGIAIGRGAADVAREASDLVVTSGDYATLPAAVAEGRQIYANIRRAVHFLLLCSLATIAVMLIAIVTDLPLPMSPLQLLWLNLVVHIFPAMALVLVPGERDVLARPPRDPAEPLLTWRATGSIALRSALVAGTVLWGFAAGGGRSGGPRGQTLVMATLALALLAQSFATLSDSRPFWRMRSSLAVPFWLALSGGLLLQAVAVAWPPLAAVLGTEPLAAVDWLRTAGMAALALVAAEALKRLDAPG
ncbi:MAG: cation-transporting P-type ATPase, partial [Thermoanaerobaculia bacterium]